MQAAPSVTPASAVPAPALASLGAGVRWATLALGLVLAAISGATTLRVGAWALGLAALAAWQGDDRARKLPGAAELAVEVAAVMSTGAWGSPFVFCVFGGILTIGFAGGLTDGLVAAVAASVAVAGRYLFQAEVPADSLRLSGQWAVELGLVAVLAAYARRLFGEAQERHTLTLDRMSQLTEANDLLVSLHRVAQTLPASLDLQQVLASTVNRLRSLIDCDVVAVLLHDEATGAWTLGAAEGASLPATVADAQLPRPLVAATTSSVASLVVSLAPGESLGPEILSRSGLYAPLRARGALVGLVALEQHEPGFYGRRDLRLLDGFVGAAALAIDNARWFARLRTIGADEERVRIARDMHDSVGQSLAFVAFKLDRLTGMAKDPAMRDELDGLRNEVRGVLTEVRDTLCDLRTEVTDSRGLVETLEEFLDRVRERADFEVSFSHQASGRLPLVQERELWQVAHEAVVNVEHHARARHLRVRWECDGAAGHLTVADDGQGFRAGRAAGPGSYGLQGMRERANAIGARLEIDSEPFVGTVVECRVGGST
ncbi:MAG TPA: GAF domain-containing sensor histidine kinase [Acidimicrobiales bacterium]|nr:GAF domain-containing sensor histidine kinase [Acidimicrobiales bacterium]